MKLTSGFLIKDWKCSVMLINGPIARWVGGRILSAPVNFQDGNENLKTQPQAPALMVEMSHSYKPLRAEKTALYKQKGNYCLMQETIIKGPTRPSMQKSGGVGERALQSAHAALHQVELTECRLEASSDPAEWRRCEERKQERKKSRRLRRSSG